MVGVQKQEEGVLLEVLRGRGQGRWPGAEMLPLFLLKVGGASCKILGMFVCS